MHTALWSILQQFIRQGLAAGFLAVLMRRISPVELGILGIANIWNLFLTLFLELGFGAALVQRKEITPAHIASAFLANIISGTVLMLLSMAASGQVSVMMKAPQAQPIIFTMSISFLITAAAAAQNALAQRELRFKTLAQRDFAANSIAAAIGIVLVFEGFGIWAVVANSIIGNLLGAIFIWRVTPHRIVLKAVSMDATRDLWAFGSKVVAYTGVKYLLKNTDSIVIGILFGPEKLGIYNLAQRVTAAPTKAIQAGISSFLFPRASKVQDKPESLRELFLITYKLLNYVITICSIVLVTLGMEVLVMVFGRQWTGAVHVIRLMMVIQLVSPGMAPMGELLKATNRPNWLLGWTILLTVATLASLVIGSGFGFEGSVVGMVAGYWMALPFCMWLVGKISGLTISEFWSRVQITYALGVLAATATFLIWWSISNLYIAASGVLAVAALQAGAGYFLDSDLRSLAKRLLRRRPVVEAAAVPVY